MLRFISPDRADASASKPSPISARRIGLALLAVSAAGLGGCSTDFLRFDSPVFNLSDEDSGRLQSSAESSGDYAPTGATLAQSRSVNSYDPGGYRSPVASVERTPRADQNSSAPRSVVLADAAPGPTRQGEATPIATGALGNQANFAQGTITVERGDTLYQLSRRHGVSVAALKDANGLTGNIIRPGQTLRLPSQGAAIAARDTRMPARPAPRSPSPPMGGAGGGYVTVRPGDSLYGISRRTGVSVGELKRINNIEDVRRLRPGMRLALGGTGGAQQSRTAEIAQPERRSISRTDFGQTPTIKAKPIRTVSISRDMAPAASEPRGDANAPRILNGAGTTASQPAAAGEDATESDANTAMKFRWPAKGRIIATFNNTGRGVKNDGINISLPIGTPIQAVEGGTVAYAGSELKGYGNLILLRHDNGWVSAYAHASELLVKRGDKVEKGEEIAKAGRSGGVTQPQLHFQLRRQATPVDPLPHMAAM
jgi:murein DD-endopeptidase MepM/ murein hydrolase activator NlpD